MSLLGNKVLQIKRRYQGEYVDGIWVGYQDGPDQIISITGSVQPAKDSDVQLLPEGRRTQRSYKIYTFDEIKEQDIVPIYDELYEVLNVSRYDGGLIPHWRAIATAMQREGTR